jgi:hypothetical protein
LEFATWKRHAEHDDNLVFQLYRILRVHRSIAASRLRRILTSYGAESGGRREDGDLLCALSFLVQSYDYDLDYACVDIKHIHAGFRRLKEAL